MRLFSNRNRPYAWGPYPQERLARVPALPPGALDGPWADEADPDGLAAGEPSLAASIAPYQALLRELRDGEVHPPPEGLGFPPRLLADNLKATAYFMDAVLTAMCEIPAEARRTTGADDPCAGHTHAVAILVEPGLPPEPDGPEAPWLGGAQRARGVLRAGEIACTIAGYLRHLGFAARAHFGSASEVRPEPLLVASGLGRRDAAGAVVNPFLGIDYTAAVVTTAAELAPDRPLRPARNGRGLGCRHPGWWLGWWGTRPGWRRLRDDRPAHLGRYPMERLRRRDTPTTYISDDVPRVPMRANFFTRAVHGDLGERPRVERGRFALKHPMPAAMAPLFMAMVPHQDGAPAPTPDPATADPGANARAVKAACHFLGADVAGICEVPDYAWYSHDEEGRPVTTGHKYAIVILIDQGYETMEGASGDDWISGAQSMRAYLRGAEITGVIARHLRARGHAAKSHTNRLSDVLHIPLILLAGLGELSRIGELVLNPFVGPRFKSAVITTDMPLVPDRPIDFGLQDFCEKCRKCARECPCNAIPFGPKTMFNGYEMWKPDVEKCARYRLTNQKGSACGRCMKMCPYNTEGLARDRRWLWAAMHLPWARGFLAVLDDWLGHGRQNPAKQWWFDLEVVDGRTVPARGTNVRGLNRRLRVPTDDQKIAHYPADLNPAPDDPGPTPLDRREGLRRAREAPRPPGAG